MPVTRTRISDDYIKDTCPSNGTTTRTRISGDYIRGSCSATCEPTIRTGICGDYSWRGACDPVYNPYPRTYIHVNPYSYHPPVIVADEVSEASLFVGLLLTALVVTAIGLVILNSPTCRIEEVCEGSFCHLDRVCKW